MFVCSCHAVSDRTIRVAIAGGASTVDEVSARCAAGGACGGCRPEIERLLDERRAGQDRTVQYAVA